MIMYYRDNVYFPTQLAVRCNATHCTIINVVLITLLNGRRTPRKFWWSTFEARSKRRGMNECKSRCDFESSSGCIRFQSRSITNSVADVSVKVRATSIILKIVPLRSSPSAIHQLRKASMGMWRDSRTEYPAHRILSCRDPSGSTMMRGRQHAP